MNNIYCVDFSRMNLIAIIIARIFIIYICSFIREIRWSDFGKGYGLYSLKCPKNPCARKGSFILVEPEVL